MIGVEYLTHVLDIDSNNEDALRSLHEHYTDLVYQDTLAFGKSAGTESQVQGRLDEHLERARCFAIELQRVNQIDHEN